MENLNTLQTKPITGPLVAIVSIWGIFRWQKRVLYPKLPKPATPTASGKGWQQTEGTEYSLNKRKSVQSKQHSLARVKM